MREGYSNVTPTRIWTVNFMTYNFYKLPRGIWTNPNAIVHHFINPETHRIIPLHIPRFSPHIVGLIHVVNGRVHFLQDEAYPNDDVDVFVVIPQIPFVTINYVERPVRRMVSNFVKEWDITLDLTCNTGETETECVICLDVKPRTQVAKTNCGHEYCIGCVKNHIQVNKDKTTKLTCPMCRAELNELLVMDVEEHTVLHDFIVAL
jgi:hypothetical protein